MINKCCQNNNGKQKILTKIKSDFDVLNDINRLRILCLLKENKEICVCEIFEALDLSQNLTSYHLGKLKESGFLKSRKVGANIFYRQNEKRLLEFQKFIKLIL